MGAGCLCIGRCCILCCSTSITERSLWRGKRERETGIWIGISMPMPGILLSLLAGTMGCFMLVSLAVRIGVKKCRKLQKWMEFQKFIVFLILTLCLFIIFLLNLEDY